MDTLLQILGTLTQDLLKNLTLKKGELFFEVRQYERVPNTSGRHTHKNGYWAVVNVQEELSGADSLRVTFSVLVFPLQTIIVDGNVLQSAKESANDAAAAH